MTDPRLTDREHQVARLVSQGMTNRQIAEELTITVRTVDTHVTHIREKLGVRTRGEVACWVLERRAEATEKKLAGLFDAVTDGGYCKLCDGFGFDGEAIPHREDCPTRPAYDALAAEGRGRADGGERALP